jgi:secondary thiamine-phosphate synthase enzyme
MENFKVASLKVKTQPKKYYNLTNMIEEQVRGSGVKNGFCIVLLKATTAGLILNEDDPMLIEDLFDVFEKISGEDEIWHHADNAWSHIRSALTGTSQFIQISDGRLNLGAWQSILLLEFDVRPRERQIDLLIFGK